jgi:nitrogen regulatory protein PII
MQDEIIVLTDAVLITCVVQRGAADAVVEAARQAGAQGATIFHARGTGTRQRLGILAVTVNADKEVIQIVAPSGQSNHIFDAMYKAAQLDTPGMGLMFMTELEKMATHVPPELVARLTGNGA